MANIDTLTDKLSAIGDAIREKTGKEETMTLDEMPTEIESISGGGSEGLNDDFRAFIESNNPQLSFTTYKSNGTQILKPLFPSNITDIDMPNLTKILAPIPINNTIARKLESYPLTNINTTSAFSGSCDKLELIQSAKVNYNYNLALHCPLLAVPNFQHSSNIYINDGDEIRKIYWPSETSGVITGRSGGSIKHTDNLILTRTAVASLTSVSTSYFNPNINVFVPASLLDSYKTATNWSTIADQIFAIEDSEIILKGIFNELDRRYGWSGELTLLQKLQSQKRLGIWQITYDELITIANDLADNGENSEYYNYKDGLIIKKYGLPITDNINLFITDTFKYKDVNDELIPLSGLLTQKEYFYNQQNGDTGLTKLWGPQRIYAASTNIGGFGESELYHKLNDSDGSLFTMLPTSLTDNLVEWKIDNDHTALLAPLSEKEIFGTNAYGDSSYDIYDQLAFFVNKTTTEKGGTDDWWERSPSRSDAISFCAVNSYGQAYFKNASLAMGLAPAIALGKKGANND